MIFSHTANASNEELNDYAKVLETLVVELINVDDYPTRMKKVVEMVTAFNTNHSEFPIHLLEPKNGFDNQTRNNSSFNPS